MAQPRYIALRTMQLQALGPAGEPLCAPGGGPLYRDVVRGDPVPEAEHWPNLRAWLVQGWLCHEHEYSARPAPAAAPAAPDPPPQGPSPAPAAGAAAAPPPRPPAAAAPTPRPPDESAGRRGKRRGPEP